VQGSCDWHRDFLGTFGIELSGFGTGNAATLGFNASDVEHFKMRKFSSMVACVAAVSMSTVAFAQDSVLDMRVANQGGATCATTGANENATLRLAPASQDAALGFGSSYSTGSLSLVLTINAKGDGCGGEIIGALGLNVNSAATSGSGALSATGWTFENAANWSGTNAPVLGGGAVIVDDARAVAVPDSSGSVLWNGFCPGTHTVATLDLSADSLGSGEAVFALNMSVSPLKITRVYDPSGTNGGSPEMIAFGYNGGSPDTAVSGSTVGAGAAGNADATVIIRKKGDFGQFDPNTAAFIPVADGSVVIAELPNFLASVGTGDAEQQFLGDFGQFDPNTAAFIPTPDCAVVIAELPQFLAAVGS
jgi:hypothetical protein